MMFCSLVLGVNDSHDGFRITISAADLQSTTLYLLNDPCSSSKQQQNCRLPGVSLRLLCVEPICIVASGMIKRYWRYFT